MPCYFVFAFIESGNSSHELKLWEYSRSCKESQNPRAGDPWFLLLQNLKREWRDNHSRKWNIIYLYAISPAVSHLRADSFSLPSTCVLGIWLPLKHYELWSPPHTASLRGGKLRISWLSVRATESNWKWPWKPKTLEDELGGGRW